MTEATRQTPGEVIDGLHLLVAVQIEQIARQRTDLANAREAVSQAHGRILEIKAELLEARAQIEDLKELLNRGGTVGE